MISNSLPLLNYPFKIYQRQGARLVIISTKREYDKFKKVRHPVWSSG